MSTSFEVDIFNMNTINFLLTVERSVIPNRDLSPYHNAEKGLAKACEATGAQIVDYSAAPVFMDAYAKCRHQ